MSARPRVTGMRLELEFDRELTDEEAVQAVEAEPSEAFPFSSGPAGPVLGTTRILGMTVRNDRRAVLVEFDMSDIAVPGDETLYVPEED